jgi:hypothetical protein
MPQKKIRFGFIVPRSSPVIPFKKAGVRQTPQKRRTIRMRQELYRPDVSEPPAANYTREPAQPVARGFAQLFGLHPITAITTLAANAMLFTGELATMGALVPVAFAVAIVLGAMTFICQRRMYGDNESEALVKALAVGLLTAIPTGLPGFLTVPSAVVGLVHTIRRK